MSPIFFIFTAILLIKLVFDHFVPESKAIDGLHIAGRKSVTHRGSENQDHEVEFGMIVFQIQALQITVVPSIIVAPLGRAFVHEPVMMSWKEGE